MVIDVPLGNVINMRSVWMAWFPFWRKQHLRIDDLIFPNILNEQRIQWVQKALKCNDTYIFIASCVPLIRLPEAQLKLFDSPTAS